jgi:hypothetical protein
MSCSAALEEEELSERSHYVFVNAHKFTVPVAQKVS